MCLTRLVMLLERQRALGPLDGYLDGWRSDVRGFCDEILRWKAFRAKGLSGLDSCSDQASRQKSFLAPVAKSI